MNNHTDELDRFFDLMGQICDEESTEADFIEIASIVIADPAVRRRYQRYCRMHSVLRLDLRAERSAEAVFQQIGIAPTVVKPDDFYPRATNPPITIAPTFPTSMWHGTTRFFSQEVPFACFIAAVVMGIGLIFGANIYVSHPEPRQVARDVQDRPSVVSHESMPELVGRITGMIDCRWSADGRPPYGYDNLFVGRKFKLDSGLMEITYHSGAKVILQGPCTYEVNSPAGGFLSLGKLTARVEGSGVGGRGSGSSAKPQAADIHHSSFSTHHSPHPSPLAPNPSPLFTVQTPTAVITDLGTEFGVEVDKDGVCEVQVLQGRVQAEFFASAGRTSQVMQLAAGEARRYQPSLDTVAVVPVDRQKFATMRILSPYQRWLDYSHKLRTDPALVAYYTVERHDRGNALLPNQSATGSALDGLVEGAEWVEGRLPGKLGLYFHGPKSGDHVAIPDPDRFHFNGSFSLAVWFKVNQFTTPHQPLITKGEYSWRMQRFWSSNVLCFVRTVPEDGDIIVQGTTEVADGQWHLAVAVYDESIEGAANHFLYVDGRLDGVKSALRRPLTDNGQPVWLGNLNQDPTRELPGIIDEAAVFARALSAAEVAEMFTAGNPNNTPR